MRNALTQSRDAQRMLTFIFQDYHFKYFPAMEVCSRQNGEYHLQSIYAGFVATPLSLT
jgi:hypothetical protein